MTGWRFMKARAAWTIASAPPRTPTPNCRGDNFGRRRSIAKWLAIFNYQGCESCLYINYMERVSDGIQGSGTSIFVQKVKINNVRFADECVCMVEENVKKLGISSHPRKSRKICGSKNKGTVLSLSSLQNERTVRSSMNSSLNRTVISLSSSLFIVFKAEILLCDLDGLAGPTK